MVKYKLTQTDTVLQPPNISFGKNDNNSYAINYRKWVADGNTPDPADPPPPTPPSRVFHDIPASANNVALLRVEMNQLIRKMRELGQLE